MTPQNTWKMRLQWLRTFFRKLPPYLKRKYPEQYAVFEEMFQKLCDIALASVIVIVSLCIFFYVPKTSETKDIKETVVNVVPDKISDRYLCTKIQWNVDYEETIEDAILKQLRLIPEQILKSWLSEDSAIIVTDFDEIQMLYGKDKQATNRYTIAFNMLQANGDAVNFSHIYVVGQEEYIQRALLHEMGHYLYYKYYGIKSEYTLPNFNKEQHKAFLKDYCNGNEYYSSKEEYFAEMFRYTILHGVSTEYFDTYTIQAIIDDF